MTPKVSIYKFALKYGLIAGIVLVLTLLIPYITNTITTIGQWPLYFYYVVFVLVIFYTIRLYSKNYELNIKVALKIGLTIAVTSALIFAFYTIFFDAFIDPDFAEQQIERTRKTLQAMPEMTEERLEQLMKHSKRSHNPITGSAIFLLVNSLFGLLYSFISALIFRKQKSIK